MKLSLQLFLIAISLLSFNAQSQDTITVQTITWDSAGREGWYTFPDLQTSEIERINLIYNIRCKNAQVGNGGVGCGEWDYSCNTFVTDTFRKDSVLQIQRKFVIPNFTGSEFYYSNNPTSNCISYFQKRGIYSGLSNEINGTIGTLDQNLKLKSETGKFYFLFTAAELSNANLKAGKIHGLRWNIVKSPGELSFLKIKMKNTRATSIQSTGFDLDNLTEVYFLNTPVPANGLQTLMFYNSFNWDGTSQILVEMSYNANPTAGEIELGSQTIQNVSVGANEKSYSLYQFGAAGFELEPQKLKQISNEVSIGFWAYGDPDIMPVNSSILEASDAQNNRQLNVHLPWSNGSVYWDCGNDGTGYDRIEKAAQAKDYEGQWTHWAFTKNVGTGVMQIYKNGILWHSGSGKRKAITVDKMKLASDINNQLSYFGRISHFAIWNKELDSLTIRNFMFDPGNNAHPAYNSLLYYLPLNDGDQNKLNDLSPNPATIPVATELNWYEEKGRNIVSGFQNLQARPVTTFIQGTINTFNLETISALEEFSTVKTPVTEYEILNGKPVVKNKFLVYPAGDFIIKDENGTPVDFKVVPEDGIFVMEDLKYQRYDPAKFEILSLVTPYGNGLDLTKDGKTFVFDITDYAPVLRGSKKISVEFGAWQEEMDLKFQFIKGKPAREVKEIQNIYAFQRGYIGNILNNEVFEPRNLKLHPDANSYKIRTTVTGHEQNGEFVSRSHFVRVDGNKSFRKFDFTVWKECADNPIFPQGGTWIFDRAGWCPGAASDVHQFDITSLGDPGSPVRIDYGLNGANMDAANYLVSCQLVSYGAAAYAKDAGIEAVIRPNVGRVEFERFNPACSRPAIQVKNFGSEDIRSLLIRYNVLGGRTLEFLYQGEIKPLEIKTIDLPVDHFDFWTNATTTLFEVEILKVNDINDENSRNNKMSSNFKLVRIFDFDPIFEIRTNNIAGDNSYRIKDMNGNILIEKKNLPAATTTQENLNVPNGCYTLEVDDQAQDGLSFWYYPNYGSGNSSIKRRVNNNVIPMVSFKPDFGAGFKYDFIVNKVTATDDESTSYVVSLYPNPVNDLVNLEVLGAEGQEAIIYLLNAAGQKVLMHSIPQDGNSVQKQFSLAGLAKGMYFMHIQLNDKILIRKLILD
ncbi:MAG: T9SS type A sorting domain-containing protein [Saprospiraceae bacterium]|nr:T9SS type A sorting domain-containing protein [Saprospiraceae bacterium]